MPLKATPFSRKSAPSEERSGLPFSCVPLFPAPFLVVALTAFAVLVPFFFLGIPSGHDFEFHLNSWMEVLNQWKQGVLYPRWAAQAHYGYGEPRFVFYPPFSWALGATLGALLPWKFAPGAYVWVVLTLSGCSMFALAREWLNRGDAIFAAALYAANPYYLVVVYWRSAFAELLAGALLPLLLLFLLRLEREHSKAAVPLALVVAAAWLTNAPGAVMVNYSLALLTVTIAVFRRSPRILLWGAAAAGLGAALAAFYILPAAYEERWVAIAQVLSPGVRPQDNFLFDTIDDPEHNRFNLLVSIVASAELAILALAAFLSRRWAAGSALAESASGQRAESMASLLRWTLLIWAVATSLLMCSFTFVFYRTLPQLRFVQLPWRWLLCLNFAFALLVTMAWRRWQIRLLVGLVMLAVLALVWQRVQPPWWDTAGDIAEMEDNQQDGPGYEGTDEYVPQGADAYEINKDAHRVAFEGGGSARLHVLEWGPESKLLTADVSKPGTLVLRLFNYPAWRVEVNGHATETETREVTGQMTVPVETGKSRVKISFTRTWDRTLGGWISAAALFILAGAALMKLHSP